MKRREVWGVLLLAASAAVLFFVLRDSGPDDPPPEDFIARPESPVTDAILFEDAQSEITGTLIAAFRAPELDAFSADFLARLPMDGSGQAFEDDGIRILTSSAGAASPVGREAFLKWLRNRPTERSDLHCFEFLLADSTKRATARYDWHLAGRPSDGRSIELQMVIEIEAVRDAGPWLLRRLAVDELTRIESDRSPFVDVTAETGFDFFFSLEARSLIQAVINGRRGGTTVGGLSVVDWNGDGFPDVIATYGRRRALLLVNDGDGGFLPRELPGKPAFFHLFVDLDNDGREELVSTHPGRFVGSTAALELFTRHNGEWVSRPAALVFQNPPALRDLAFTHISTCDVDGDGLLDLFVSGYRNSDTRPAEYIDADDGQRNLLFINQGSLRFEEEALERGIDRTRRSYLSEFLDIDEDGDRDLLVINDFGPDALYLNRGNAMFDRCEHLPFGQGTTNGMGLAIADYDNSGAFSLYISNMYSYAGQRLLPRLDELDPANRTMLSFLARGNTLYDRVSGGQWAERAVERGIHNAGWAWGCLFFDADNDADKDLVVVNGFTSNQEPDTPDY